MGAMASQTTGVSIVCLIICWSTKTSKLRITDLCAGNSPVIGEFPAQRASNMENVSIWWRHHDIRILKQQNDRTHYTTAINQYVSVRDYSHTSHKTSVPHPTMHLSEHGHSSVLNGALWKMEQVHCGICLFGVWDQDAHSHTLSKTEESHGFLLNHRLRRGNWTVNFLRFIE